jgi:hypothetical protein
MAYSAGSSPGWQRSSHFELWVKMPRLVSSVSRLDQVRGSKIRQAADGGRLVPLEAAHALSKIIEVSGSHFTFDPPGSLDFLKGLLGDGFTDLGAAGFTCLLE